MSREAWCFWTTIGAGGMIALVVDSYIGGLWTMTIFAGMAMAGYLVVAIGDLKRSEERERVHLERMK